MFPVIRPHTRCLRLPDENLDPSVKEQLLKGSECLLPYEKETVPLLLKRFECYLQITNRLLSPETFKGRDFWLIALIYIGALNSEKFTTHSPYGRYKASQIWLKILTNIDYEHNDFFWPLQSMRSTPAVEYLVDTFEGQALNHLKVAIWNGWEVVNKQGVKSHLYLYPLVKLLGHEYANKFHHICKSYFKSQSTSYIEGIEILIRFLDSLNSKTIARKLNDTSYMTNFWLEFLIYYIQYQASKGISVRTIGRAWNTAVKPLCINHLIPNGLLAAPNGPFPEAPSRYTPPISKIGYDAETGENAFLKLLTPVPLELTDDQALSYLFRRIKEDLDIVVRWARERVRSTWYAYKRRSTKLWAVREPRSSYILTIPKMSSDGIKAISHYKTNGFRPVTNIVSMRRTYSPMPANAILMGMPVTGAILPHCLLLAHLHPEITPAFLEHLKIFNSNGDETGFIKTDAGWVLSGHKYRKGTRTARQTVILNDEAINLVRQIIEITRDAREYLKRIEHPDWQYLLLSTGKSFAEPRRSNRLAAITSGARYPKIRESLIEVLGLSYCKAEAIARALSLPCIRATTVLVEYLETGDAIRMSKRLGHEKYDPSLLRRYLPDPLYQIFQDRWIRVFQNGMIAEVMRDSRNLLRATDFNDRSQLLEFLKNHSTQISQILRPGSPAARTNQQSELVFIVSELNLLALMNLRAISQNCAPEAIRGESSYWLKVFEHVENYIDNSTDRPDLKVTLERARKQQD